MKKYNEDEVKSLTKAQISEKLTEEGVLFDPASKKDELIAKLLDIELPAKLLDIELPEPEQEPEPENEEGPSGVDVEETSGEENADSTSGDEDESEEEPKQPEETETVEETEEEEVATESDDEEEDERFSKIEDLAEGYLAAIDNLPTGKVEQEPEGAVKAVFAARAKERVGTVAVRAAKRF